MITADQNTARLKEKIKAEIDVFDADKIRKLYDFIADMAAANATRIADEAWERRKLSREKIAKAVESLNRTRI